MRDAWLKWAIGILAAAGLAISGYLTYVHFFELEPICLTGGCEAVQSSEYSQAYGIPVALIGMVGYSLILLSLFIRRSYGRLLGVVFTFVGLGYSLYLTYLEIYQIKAICQWCVASAVIVAVITILAAIRYMRPEEDVKLVD